jgi:hypothetical protein
MNTTTQKQVVILQVPKNPGVAALLGCLLGPIGLFYAGRLWPAVIMFFLGGFVVVFTFGLGLVIVLPICAIWSYSSAKAFNQKLMEGAS